MKYITLHLVCIFLPLLAVANKLEYDEFQYAKINTYIREEINKKTLVGKPYDQLRKELNLSNVPWNLGVSKAGNTEIRIYHFQGFYLSIHLKLQQKNSKFTLGYSAAPSNLDQAERFVTTFGCELTVDEEKNVDVRLKNIRDMNINGFKYTPENSPDPQLK